MTEEGSHSSQSDTINKKDLEKITKLLERSVRAFEQEKKKHTDITSSMVGNKINGNNNEIYINTSELTDQGKEIYLKYLLEKTKREALEKENERLWELVLRNNCKSNT